MIAAEATGTLLASGIVRDKKENMFQLLHDTGITYLKGLGVRNSILQALFVRTGQKHLSGFRSHNCRSVLYLSILPSLLFVESGIVSGNLPLILFSVIFAPCHIVISYKNQL